MLLTTMLIHFQLGKATHYAPEFEGHRMANGEIFHQTDMVAASNLYPLGTHIYVKNILTGESVSVIVKDRTAKRFRVLDLSSAAYYALGGKKRDGWVIVRMTEVKEN